MSDTEREPKDMVQKAPWPYDLDDAVRELKPTAGLSGWLFYLEEENRGQGCYGLTLSIIPNNPDSYYPKRHANTRFLYPVPAASFNRDSWEEWLWARIEETEGHERAEGFRFVDKDGKERRPFKPVHADGWDPGVIRRTVDQSIADIPNTGRFVRFPCRKCGHQHSGRMGPNFTIERDNGCIFADCLRCGKEQR